MCLRSCAAPLPAFVIVALAMKDTPHFAFIMGSIISPAGVCHQHSGFACHQPEGSTGAQAGLKVMPLSRGVGGAGQSLQINACLWVQVYLCVRSTGCSREAFAVPAPNIGLCV